MKLQQPLSPHLQRVVGQVSTQAAGVPADVQAKDVAVQAGPGLAPGRAELDHVAQQLLQQLGLRSLGDLAQVTQGHCLRCAEGPMDAMVMWSLVIAVQIHCAPAEPPKKKLLPRRQDALPKLDVEACAGEYQDRPQPIRVDPLVLKFGNVEPTSQDVPTHLYMINRSNLDDPQAVLLPGDLLKAVDGKYGLILGDAWMAEHGIKPGNVLEFYQTKGEGDAERRSPSSVVRINKGGAGLVDAPDMPPHDNIGAGPVREMFNKALDPKPAAVRPERMQACLRGDTLEVGLSSQQPALEPFSKVVVENLRTGEKSAVAEVGEDGAFKALVKARDGDPIMIRAVDHSHELGDAAFERLLTLQVGREAVPMLAVNPTLGIDAPPSVALGRLALSEDCLRLQSDCGLTPGSIVTVQRAGHAQETIKAVVDATGSLDVALPFAPHADDVFDVLLQNPFNAHVAQPAGWSAKARAEVRLELNEDGTLDHVRSEGAVHAADTAAGRRPVAGLDNVDRVESGTPYRQDSRLKVEGLRLYFEPFNPNTGNSVQLTASADSRAQHVTGWMAWDKAAGVLTVQVDADVRGGWPQEDKQARTHIGWGKAGEASSQGFYNQGVNPIRHAFVGLPDGAQVPVRFQDGEGRVFGEATLKTKVSTAGTGSGLGGTQQVRTLTLDPQSFRAL
jgi:hypothetical protein